MLGGLKLLSEHNTVVCLELPLRNEAEKEYAKDVENILISIKYFRRGNLRKETIFTR